MVGVWKLLGFFAQSIVFSMSFILTTPERQARLFEPGLTRSTCSPG